MDSEVDDFPAIDEVDVVAETPRTRSHPQKKNQGKVPKRIHKAEREKMKREHLNELFLELANALDLSEQNNGKASILGETTRIVKDMLSQIECLKRENAALLSESQYVATEKNELQDENEALQNQIGKLQAVLKERMAQLKLDLNIAPLESLEAELTSHFSEDHLRLPTVEPASQQAPMVGPVYVIPVHSDLQVYPEPISVSKPISGVCKPHARYPTPADSWPSKLLKKQLELGKESQQNGGDS
ncbi:hypothetical protein LguiB_007883 [Lonicera macranthoides]